MVFFELIGFFWVPHISITLFQNRTDTMTVQEKQHLLTLVSSFLF